MRARTIRLHTKTEEKLKRLKKESEEVGAYRVAKRISAILLNGKGKTSCEIAELIDTPRSCVASWLRNYEEHGFEGLLEGHRSGRPAKLTEAQKSALSDIIESGPTDPRSRSGKCTCARACQTPRCSHYCGKRA